MRKPLQNCRLTAHCSRKMYTLYFFIKSCFSISKYHQRYAFNHMNLWKKNLCKTSLIYLYCVLQVHTKYATIIIFLIIELIWKRMIDLTIGQNIRPNTRYYQGSIIDNGWSLWSIMSLIKTRTTNTTTENTLTPPTVYKTYNSLEISLVHKSSN